MGGADPPLAVYVYAQKRKSEQPLAHLAGFAGVVQVDGYAGYLALVQKNSVSLAFCWAHVRRRFYELAAAGLAPIASVSLERIGALYSIESQIGGQNPDERHGARQEKCRLVLAELEPWLREKLALISQKTKLAEAIRYALSRWDGLMRFLDDGGIEIDSNIVESVRATPLRSIGRTRSSQGSDGGAENWAILASLIETCKLNRVDPLAYMTDVLTKIVEGHLASKLDELRPWAFAPPVEIKDVT
ncbi:IS66 family transposase [Methylocystis sp. IM2]|uniref:IS66 family transposase n=1 Tax=unclassified Methylocystis TaxID=2625913 RepID=UPI0040484B82